MTGNELVDFIQTNELENFEIRLVLNKLEPYGISRIHYIPEIKSIDIAYSDEIIVINFDTNNEEQ